MRHSFAASVGGREPRMQSNRLLNEPPETSDTTDISRKRTPELLDFSSSFLKSWFEAHGRRLLRNLAISFFLFGLFNNGLYIPSRFRDDALKPHQCFMLSFSLLHWTLFLPQHPKGL